MLRLALLALAALALVGVLWRASAGPADPPPTVSPAALATPPAAEPAPEPEPGPGPGPLELLRGEQVHTLHLEVRVVDADGRALAGAEVLLAGRRAGRSDAAGRFEATFPRLVDARGDLVLEVAAPGYETWRRRVAARDGEVQARARLSRPSTAARDG